MLKWTKGLGLPHAKSGLNTWISVEVRFRGNIVNWIVVLYIACNTKTLITVYTNGTIIAL